MAGGALPLPSELVRSDAIECFWSAQPFGGWSGESGGATPYSQYLGRVAGF
jgi:hypothetical protein